MSDQGRTLVRPLTWRGKQRAIILAYQKSIRVDETALEGRYDFSLTYTPDAIALDPSTRAGLPAIDPDGPALDTALQEQLGLRLRSSRASVDVLILDEVRPPTPD